MRYLIILFLLATNQVVTAQTGIVSTSTMFPGYLEGDFAIRHASARPAPRTSYLIYAAALDRYAIENKDVLASHPPLALLVQDAKSRALGTFDHYSKIMGGFAPIFDRKGEIAELERLIASGYSGDLKAKILDYVEELKK